MKQRCICLTNALTERLMKGTKKKINIIYLITNEVKMTETHPALIVNFCLHDVSLQDIFLLTSQI